MCTRVSVLNKSVALLMMMMTCRRSGQVPQRNAIPTTSKQYLTVQTQVNSTMIFAQCPMDALGSMNTAVQNSCKCKQHCVHDTTSFSPGRNTTDHRSCARQSISSSNELPSPHPRAPTCLGQPASTSRSSLPTCAPPDELGRNHHISPFLRPSFTFFTARRSISLMVMSVNKPMCIKLRDTTYTCPQCPFLLGTFRVYKNQCPKKDFGDLWAGYESRKKKPTRPDRACPSHTEPAPGRHVARCINKKKSSQYALNFPAS